MSSKAQEYKNSPLSPRSSAIRLQKRLKAVELSFASKPPVLSSSSSSPSSSNTSRRILSDQTISESSITSPPDSQIPVPSPLIPSNHPKNSFECVKPVATPDDGFLTEVDIEKMLDDETDIFTPQPCDYRASHKVDLLRHSKAKHQGVKNSCSECDYSTSYKQHLLRHSKAKHQGVKYSCSKCDYSTSYKHHLLRHSKSKHEGSKYACDQCDFEAPEKSHISFHVKYIHEGVSHPCSQ